MPEDPARRSVPGIHMPERCTASLTLRAMTALMRHYQLPGGLLIGCCDEAREDVLRIAPCPGLPLAGLSFLQCPEQITEETYRSVEESVSLVG